MGTPGQFDNSHFLADIERIKKFIPNSKMAIHIPTNVKKEIKKYRDYGIIAVGMDTTALVDSYKEIENA